MTLTDVTVVDASVLAKCFLDEPGADAARGEAMASAWIAPDLILIEITSIAATTLGRGLIERDFAAAMVALSPRLVMEHVPSRELCVSAFSIAADFGFSAYDATYVALAQARGTVLLTADVKLVGRAERSGIGQFVRALRLT